MADKKGFIAVRYEDYSGARYLRIEQVASMSGVHPELIERFVRLGLIDPVGRTEKDETWLFDVEVVPIVKKIIRLRNDLGINYAGIGVVLDLLSRLEELERRISLLELRISSLMDSK